jgi:hypothetical protein
MVEYTHALGPGRRMGPHHTLQEANQMAKKPEAPKKGDKKPKKPKKPKK